MSIDVSPEPTEEELAAIMAVYEALRPRSNTVTVPEPASRWRFASRSWATRSRYGGWI